MILNSSGNPIPSSPTAILKPCPFCGGTNIQPESNRVNGADGYWFRCQTCSCTGGYDLLDDASRSRAVERWNAPRALEADVRKKTLDEMLQFLDTHTPVEGVSTNAVRLCFKVLRTELLKLTACKDMDDYLKQP